MQNPKGEQHNFELISKYDAEQLQQDENVLQFSDDENKNKLEP